MATPQDAMDAGLPPADKEFLDLRTAQIMKEPKLPSEHALRKEQLNMSPQPPPPPPHARSPAEHVVPRYSDTEIQSPVAGNKPIDTVVMPQEAPPIHPQDTPRVQDRINKLYGKMKSAEERAAEAESRLRELEMASRTEFRPPMNSGNPYFPYQPPQFAPVQPPTFEPTPISPSPDAGLEQAPYVSRQELARIMAQQTQMLIAQNEAMYARTASRAEAERDYPDVFSRPELRSAVEQILQSDPALRQDPYGAQKAALMVRGMNVSVVPSESGLPTTARKEAIASLGPSVPEGQAQPTDQAARYQAALQRASATQRPEDFALARRIQLGQA